MAKLRTVVAMAAGAAAAYWFDPQAGRSRRARARDQAAARLRRLRRSMAAEIEYRKGMARGLVHEAAGAAREERRFDDQTLRQKVRSEALGPWAAAAEGRTGVDLEVSDGTVTVTGPLPDQAARGDLMRRIERVEGVAVIEDRTQVSGGGP